MGMIVFTRLLVVTLVQTEDVSRRHSDRLKPNIRAFVPSHPGLFVKSKKSATLFEVFCSNRSRLTHQVNSLGGKANRYFKDQTDLMTPEGRAVLFQDLLEQEPEHVWYAPECGPWSAWSNLNQAKSIEGWLQVQSRRWDNIDQLALGVVLLRHQRARGHHFHWEQPGRSNMFQTPILIPRLLPPSLICATWDICVTLRMVSL